MRTDTLDNDELSTNPTVESRRAQLAPFFDVVYIVDRSQARIFGTDPFRVIDTIDNSLGREKSRAMRNDRPGFADESDPHQEAAQQFARMLSQKIQRRLQENANLKILIVCEAKMHGYLHRYVDDKRALWHSADLAHLSEVQILNYLGERRSEFEAKDLIQ